MGNLISFFKFLFTSIMTAVTIHSASIETQPQSNHQEQPPPTINVYATEYLEVQVTQDFMNDMDISIDFERNVMSIKKSHFESIQDMIWNEKECRELIKAIEIMLSTPREPLIQFQLQVTYFLVLIRIYICYQSNVFERMKNVLSGIENHHHITLSIEFLPSLYKFVLTS